MTTFATSSIPAFRAALIATLQARAGLNGVSVVDGPPEPAVLERREHVALLATTGRQSIQAMARTIQPRDERYTQAIEISVAGATRADQVTLGERAFALLAEIEQAIRSEPDLGSHYSGPGHLHSVVMGDEDYETYATDAERESRLTVGLDVHARLR